MGYPQETGLLGVDHDTPTDCVRGLWRHKLRDEHRATSCDPEGEMASRGRRGREEERKSGNLGL